MLQSTKAIIMQISKQAAAARTIVRPPFSPSCISVRGSRALSTARAMYEESQAGNGGGYDPGSPPPRALAKFSIYKGKSALQLSLIAPTWKDTSKGTGSVYVDRSGVLFLEFASINANAPQQAGYGNRSYSWDMKLVFALKPAELGNFLDSSLIAKGFELFHDPDMGTPNAGTSRKTLSVKLNPDSSYMISLNQSEKTGSRQSVSVPVTPAEMAVIQNISAYAVPRLLGFDMACEMQVLPPS